MKKYLVSAALIVVFVTPNVAMAAPGATWWSAFWSWWQVRSSRQHEQQPTVPTQAEVQNNVITTPNTQTPPTPINSAAPVSKTASRSVSTNTIVFPDIKAGYYIKSVDFKKHFDENEVITFKNLKGIETTGGISEPTPGEGFNVQAVVMYPGQSKSDPLPSINAEYDPVTHTWNGTFSGGLKSGTYVFQPTLYCSDHTKACFGLYGDDYEAEPEITFTVGTGIDATGPGNSTATNSNRVKIISPNGGEILTVGQSTTVRWIDNKDAGSYTIALVNISNNTSSILANNVFVRSSGINGNSSYVVTIPPTDATGKYKIEVYEATARELVGRSENYFTVTYASPSPTPSASSAAVNLTSKPTSVNTPNSVDYIVTATAQFDKVTFRADCDGSLITINTKGGLFCGESVTVNITPTYQTSFPVIWSTKDGKNHLTGMTAYVYSNGTLIGTDRDAMTVIGSSQPDGALNVNFVNSTTNTSYGTYPLIISTDNAPRFVYPAGGETFVKTNSYMIKHLGGSGNAKIELINFSTGAATLVSASYPLSATTMSYVTFEFPSVIPAGTYYFKMSRTTDRTELAKSGTFTVADPEPGMGIVLPGGQRTFNPGQTIGLYYNGSNYPAGTTVDIKLGRRDLVAGSSIETLMTLATKQPINGTYNWSISTGLASRNDYVVLACPSTGGKCGYTNTFTVNPAPNATYTPAAVPATY